MWFSLRVNNPSRPRHQSVQLSLSFPDETPFTSAYDFAVKGWDFASFYIQFYLKILCNDTVFGYIFCQFCLRGDSQRSCLGILMLLKMWTHSFNKLFSQSPRPYIVAKLLLAASINLTGMPNNSFALHRKQSSANIYQSSRHFHLLSCQEVYLLNSKVDGYPLVWLIRTSSKVHFQLSLVWQKHLLNDFRCEQFWWGCEVLQTLAQQETSPPMDKHSFEQRDRSQSLYCRQLKTTLFSWSANNLDLDQIF